MSAWRGKTLRKRKKKKPSFAPYRSGLEKRVHQILGVYDYEPKTSKCEYMIPHNYTPDFVYHKNPNILIEVKGYFRDGSSEASKYKSVARDNPAKDIIFLFSDPYRVAYPQCAVRKDGSRQTLAEWCKRNSFLFYCTSEIPKALVEGKIDRGWIKEQKRKRGIKL